MSTSKAKKQSTHEHLPDDMEWLFPEYSFSEITAKTHHGVIIERVLERGTWAQARWLFATYGEKAVTAWVQRHGFRLLSKRSFALWRLALDIADYQAPDWAVEAKKLPEAW